MKDQEQQGSLEQLDGLEEGFDAGDETAKELFAQISHIALCLSYDMIDKLRWWEKEVMKLSDEEVDERIPQLSEFLEELKTAYLKFPDPDL